MRIHYGAAFAVAPCLCQGRCLSRGARNLQVNTQPTSGRRVPVPPRSGEVMDTTSQREQQDGDERNEDASEVMQVQTLAGVHARGREEEGGSGEGEECEDP